MNVSCDVITDLLPLYHDEVCNEASRKLVEEHLAQCDSCAAMLKQMRNNSFDTHMTQEPENVVRHHTKAIKRKSLFAGISIVIIPIIIAVLTVFLWPLSFSNIISDDTELWVNVRIQHEDGRIISRGYVFEPDSEASAQIREILDGYSFRRVLLTPPDMSRTVHRHGVSLRYQIGDFMMELNFFCTATGRFGSTRINLPGATDIIIVNERFYHMNSDAKYAMKTEILNILTGQTPFEESISLRQS